MSAAPRRLPHSPEVFKSPQRQLMINILSDLKIGYDPTRRVTKRWELLVMQETCCALRDAGYIDAEGELTAQGLFVAMYPHLAPLGSSSEDKK